MNILRNASRYCLLTALLLAFPACMRAQLIFITNSGAITITGYNGNPKGLVIPQSTNGHAVVSIGNLAFATKSSLTSVTIPNSVTNIGTGGFQFCSGLTNVVLGSGLISIGDNAFSYDSALRSMSIPNSVKSVGSMAFNSCTAATNILIGNSVTNIGAQAFIACYDLATISVGSANPMFSSLNGVLFNKNKTKLLQYPGGKPGNYLVPGGVTNIGDYAFGFCSRLTGVHTSNSVVSIGQYAFNDSTSLTNITLGNKVASIGSGALLSIFSLITIKVATNNPVYSSMAGVLFNKNQTMLLQYPGGKPGSYTTPDSVTTIGDNAFVACFNLTNVTIGNNVLSMGYGAFDECINLSHVAIGIGLTNIATGGFDECYSLTMIVVNPLNPAFSSVAGILYNKNQTTLIRCPAGIAGSCTVPGSVKSIGDFAFLNDVQVNTIYFEGNAPSLGSLVFGSPLTIYYLSGTTGWTPLFGGMPALAWDLQARGFGVRTNQFGFEITGSSNSTFVIEASTNLAIPSWQSLQTNTLTSGSTYFGDQQWTDYPARYYRLHWPR